ncbi:MAG: hypothetical protein IKV94_03010 [Clostridia bacterium]|nr:hypothetical protein [Clostridia bacterium]
MKEELTLKKLTSKLFWGIFLHSLWLGLVLGFVGGLVVGILSLVLGTGLTEIIESILNIALSATALFIAVKLTNNGLLSKYKINKDILQKVATKVIIIMVILEIIVMTLAVLLIPISVESSVKEAEEYYKIFGVLAEKQGSLETIKEEIEAQKPKMYVTTILTYAANLIIQVLAVKYAVYDLEKRTIVEEV